MKPGNLCRARCQIRRQTKDEDLIGFYAHQVFWCAVSFYLERENKHGKKTLYL